MAKRPIDHPPVLPIVERDAWTDVLSAVARQPLEFCEEFPTVAKRYEAWWHGEMLDRPLFMATAARDPSRPFDKHLELLVEHPEEWFERTRADVRNVRLIGDLLPSIRVDFGPVMLGGLFGARTEFGSGTTWTHPFINDEWSNAPDWTIDEDGPFWRTLVKLTAAVAADARGRYLVRTPDLGGSGDVLLNLRGSERLCIDVLERPDVVRRAVDAIYPAWRKGFTELHRIVLSRHAGIIHWIGLWSDEPYMIPACDFNYLIGPEEFDRIFLPDIARQAATAGRAVFHLDGPGATRHVDSLLEIPEMRAIQYVTGASAPAALPWLDMFRKIQSKGRSLVILCYAEEVAALLDELEPGGLCFVPFEGPAKVTVEDAFDAMCRRFGC